MLFSEAGYFLYYSIQRYQIKQEIKKELSSVIEAHLLETIELEKNAAAIEWEEEGEEFFFNNSMYDVKRIEKINGKTFLYCINDDKENALLKKMVVATEKNQKEKKNHSFKFQLPYFLVTTTFLPVPSSIPVQHIFSPFSESAIYLSGDIVIPPPKFA